MDVGLPCGVPILYISSKGRGRIHRAAKDSELTQLVFVK